MQNDMVARLKLSMAEKEYSNKFSELMHTNIRVNKEEKIHVEAISQTNTVLPSISNTKVSLRDRAKSQSAKRLPIKNQLQKNKNTKSTKRIFNEVPGKTNKLDFDDLIIKKQSLIEGNTTKQPFIRTKVFSLKTPSRDARNKESTQTKDISSGKEISHPKSIGARQMSIKQFSLKMDQLNQEIFLTLKLGRFDTDSSDYKKMLNMMTKLKSSNEEQFKKLQNTIQKILKFVDRHKIKGGVIELRRIFQLTSRKVLSNYQIVNTFLNKDEIVSLHKIVGLQFYTQPEKAGEQLAAIRITSLFKMIFSKRFYKNISNLMKKVKIIQRHWRMSLLTKRTRRQILQNINLKLKRHQSLQKELISNWNMIKTCQRYEIHVCSYSLQEFKRLTIKSLRQKENNQITRIFRAMETDVNVIYVLPFQMHEEILKYYQSIFGFNAVSIQHKIFFIVPQNRGKIQQFCPITTSSALLYSPKALKRIRQIIGKQYSYIVPSFPSVEHINLSAQLNVPLMAPHQNIAKLYSTKSGGLKLLKNTAKKEKCPFQVPKSVVSIFSQKELINALSILIYKNKDVKVWYLKIEDEIHSRGLAYLSINKVTFLREICSGSAQFQDIEQNQMIKLIAEELNSKLKNRLKIVNKDIYGDYDQYISHFLTRGGVIEAGVQPQKSSQFSISFFIQPSGEFSIVGTYNKLQLGGKSINQAIRFPSLVDQIDYEGITRHLYKQMYIRNKLFGFFTVDFMYAETTRSTYAIGLDCFLNQKTSSLFMANFSCNAHYNKDRNVLINGQEQQVHFTYCPSLTLAKMPALIPFFKSCKYENISFDLEKKVGTIFILLDRVQNQQIGILAIEQKKVSLLKEMKKIVDYCCRVYRPGKSSHDEIGLLKGAVTTSLRKQEKQKGKKLPNVQYLS